MKEEKKKIQNNFIVAAGLLALFILYTVAIMFVDVQPIGFICRVCGSQSIFSYAVWCEYAAI